MRSLSTELKTWKDSQSRLVPLITLFDIEVNDSTTMRLVQGDPDGSGSVTFGGNPYTACAIEREEHTENVEGDFPSFRLLISNINGVAGGYIEANELDGRQVTIRTGLLRGTESDYQVETYTITYATYDRKTASLTLGPPNFFKRKTNPRKFQRMRCQHAWAQRFLDDAGCGYPTDTFEADTHADFWPGRETDSEKERQFGWFTLNALKTTELGIDDLSPGVLTISSESVDIEWEPTLLNAPFIYKKISGDFDVFIEAQIGSYRIGYYAGILCQSVDVPESWVMLGLTIDEGPYEYVRGAAAEAGVLKEALSYNTDANPWLRLVRVGDVFSCYYGADGVTWTLLGTQTVAMSAPIRIGFCLSAPRIEKGLMSVSFSIFQVRSGGDATCERTREACRLKANSHRYGAFPGIPTRRGE
jgi:hypothetical protein